MKWISVIVFPRFIPKVFFFPSFYTFHNPISFLCSFSFVSFVYPISRSKSLLERGETHLLDIIIRQRPPVLQLLAREDQPLLIGRDAFFILDLRLDIVDRIRGFDFEGDGFTRESFYEAGFGN